MPCVPESAPVVVRSTPSIHKPRLEHVVCTSPAGLHRMAYWEWGYPENDRVLLCVHGLTRTGRDFDRLALAMARDYRVVCPDIVGRGRSDWLIDPAHYTVPQYVADVVTLIARLAPAQLDWVGTSMGGLIGLALAGTVAASMARRPARATADELGSEPDITFTRMVFNDIGPEIAPGGLARIASYVHEPQHFARFEEAVAHVKATSQGFGPHSDADWADITQHVFREVDGQWVKHYDLRLAEPMRKQTPETLLAASTLLWQAWDTLSVPSLVLHGADSDVLSADTLALMLAHNPQASAAEFAGVGHAPTLRTDEQIAAVRDFLIPL